MDQRVVAVSDPRPLGVFDSGVGGLTVVAALRRLVPAESILYLGDTARLPYGTKSPETVARYSRRNVDFLIGRGVKAVVIACNTASAVAIDELSDEVPVWGVIGPGARAAVEAAGDAPIGILATESTVSSDAYGRAIRRLRGDAPVISKACPLFVPLVEEGWFDNEVAEAAARRYLAPVLAAGARTLVLGCTHYPMLRPLLARLSKELIGEEPVIFVDSAEAAAAEVLGRLEVSGLGRIAAAPPSHRFCVTDFGDRFRRVAEPLLQGQIVGEGPNGDGAGGHALALEVVEV
ncbi:MAG: glutamate racemase [Acidobacteriota bacterium]